MATPFVEINQSDFQAASRGISGILGPPNGERVADKSTRAGYRRMAVPYARSLRRAARSEGYVAHARAVRSQLRVQKRGGGKLYIMRIGIDKRKKRQAKTWHLLNIGARPHHQPDAFRRGADGRLFKVEGGARHPGFQGKQMRLRATKVSQSEAVSSFFIGFRRTANREFTKLGRRYRGL